MSQSQMNAQTIFDLYRTDPDEFAATIDEMGFEDEDNLAYVEVWLNGEQWFALVRISGNRLAVDGGPVEDGDVGFTPAELDNFDSDMDIEQYLKDMLVNYYAEYHDIDLDAVDVSDSED